MERNTTSARLIVCLKTHVRVFLQLVFLVRFVAKRYILQQKCLKGQNMNLPAKNTPVQLLALYTDSESRNAQRYRQTDGQTDDMMMTITDHSFVAVRSAKTEISASTLCLRATTVFNSLS